MRRREEKPVRKHSLYLYDGDYEKLQSLVPSRIGAAKIIRDLVHAHLRKIEEMAAQSATLVADLDISLETPNE